ncbi:MAG: lysylphosphatidylglycerol synthase domain-containing protein, partial [Fibrobacteria bacterium]
MEEYPAEKRSQIEYIFHFGYIFGMTLRKAALAKFAPVLALLLFAVALVFVHKELKDVHYHELAAALKDLPMRGLLASGLSVAISYLALTGVDALGLRYAGRTLPYAKTALTSFISFVISNNFGFSAFTGGLVRFRLYSLFGISAAETVKVAGFCVITFWQGVLFLGGLSLIWAPQTLPPLPAGLHVDARVLGGLLLACFGAYLGAAFLLRKPVHIRGIEVVFPKPGLALGQLCVSILDWVGAGAALYFLLPAEMHIGLMAFLAVYIVSQTFGLVSNVPGGAGVFEASMLLLLPQEAPRTGLLAALVAYRILYYLGPLGLAAILFGGFELMQRRSAIRKGYSWIRQIADPVIPLLSGALVFLCGVVLLISGSTRALPQRMEWLNAMLPLGVLEASHFLAGLTGISLLMLARGLQLRLDAAFHITVWMLGAGAVFSLLKGFDFEEALFLGCALLFLLPSRPHFYRRSSIREEPMTPAWIASIALILGAVFWLGLFSYKHVEYRHDLFWDFALDANASRFLRSTVGIASFLILYSGWRLFRPTRAGIADNPPSGKDLDGIQPIVAAAPKAYAHLALLGDKSLLFNASRSAFIM